MLSIGLLVLRIVIGLTVAAHGAQKLFGWFGGPGISGFSGWLGELGIRPERPWALVAGLAEFLGGLCVALGLLTPIAALFTCGSLLVAILVVHASKGFWNSSGGYEFPLALVASLVGLSLTGPGAISLDQYFRLSLPEPGTWLVSLVVVLIGVLAALGSRRLQAASQPRPQAG